MEIAIKFKTFSLKTLKLNLDLNLLKCKNLPTPVITKSENTFMLNLDQIKNQKPHYLF